VDKIQDPGIQLALQTFKELTKSPSCPGGMSVADFLLATPNGNCDDQKFKNPVDLNEILNGTSAVAQQQRAFLYDHFLSRIFRLQV
jgi:hypothetical protein